MKKEIVVGILGAGRIGKVHTESIVTGVPGVRIKTIADPFMNDETAAWAKSMGVELVSKDPADVFSDNDIDAVLICSSTDTHAEFTRKAVYGYDQRAEVFGSGGAVATSNDAPSTAVLSNADGITAEKPLFFFLERYMDSFSLEMKQFVEALRSGGETPLGQIDALRPVQIAIAARKSLEEGRPVKVEK